MKQNNIFKQITEAMRKNKKLEIAVYAIIAACIVILCLFSSDTKKESEKEKVNVQVMQGDETDVEMRLANILSKIRGAGKVQVMITYDSTAELVPAMSVTGESSQTEAGGTNSYNESSSNQPATVNNGGEQEAIVLKEIQPKVRGVIVIAEGAADISVKLNLEYATAAVLGLDVSEVEVFEMTGD
ncbi:MAG: hypothetical protein IJO93_01705 [Clostridia bacterium]|nr:hypothetical protein [Clostridia bacterium]